MFQVSTIEDKAVRIQPSNLALTQLEAITQQIEATYVDKVRASEGAGRACERGMRRLCVAAAAAARRAGAATRRRTLAGAVSLPRVCSRGCYCVARD
jgi:hypothetical protein